MTYKVTVTATVTMIVEADSKAEAEEKANDSEWLGESIEVTNVEECDYEI